MNVRDLSIELRPRSDWEAVDLGTALAKRYYRDLLRIGFFGFGPLYLVLALVCIKWPLVLCFIIWWLKPLQDRFYLYYLSRRIFGQEVTVRETLGQWKRFLRGLFKILVWHRFSFSRSMNLPVTDLENLTGVERSRRCGVISRVGGGLAALVSMGGILLETIGLFSLLIFLDLLIPQGQGVSWEVMMLWFEGGELPARLVETGVYLCYGVLILLLEPIYLASGFALYLNSRTSQEAWDVELRFRELALRVENTRVKTGEGSPPTEVTAIPSESTIARKMLFPNKGKEVGALLLLVGVLLGGAGGQLSADPTDPQVVAEKVLSDDAFIIHTETYREPIRDGESLLERLLEWLRGADTSGATAAVGIVDGFFKLLGILALALLLVFIVVLIVNLVRGRNVGGKVASDAGFKRPPPSVVMGMAVTPESLPQDLLGSARELWGSGQARLALSLLYRGALTKLITEQQVSIVGSDTEYECLGRVENSVPDSLARYFRSLSLLWMKAAYSSEPVASDDFETLCSAWPFTNR